MLSTIQISVGVAAGIVLAFVLIMHGRAIAQGTAKALQAVLVLVALAALGWSLSSMPQTVSDHSAVLGDVASKAGSLFTVLTFFGLAFLGGYGLHSLFYRITGKLGPPHQNGQGPVLGLVIINAIIVVACSFALTALYADGWITAVDQYSRANGWADGLPMLMFGAFLLWPFPLLGLLKLVRGNADTEVARPEAP